MAASPARADLVDGLLNYWSLDDTLADGAQGMDGSASTVADDGAFDGANGTDGVGFAAGLFGQSIDQDGAVDAAQNNGFVRVARSADTLRAGESISISAWVETAGFDTSWQTILAHGEGTQYRIARRGGDSVAAYAGGSGDIPTTAVGPDISVDTGWHHIVAISENAVSTRIWVDGMLVETGAAPTITDNGNDGAPGGATPDLYIGANPQTGDQNREWWGKIDDVATWNRVLLDEEILEIHAAGLDGMALGQLLGPAGPGEILGTGTEALLGGDLTDVGDDGDPLLYSPPDLGGFDAEFFSSDEPGFEGGEFAFNVFDNTLGGGNEKWCCGTEFPQIVGADFSASGATYRLTHFTVSSANDSPDRDPRVWSIEGSNDGDCWTTIFFQSDPDATIWTERDQVILFQEGIDYEAQTVGYSQFRMVTSATGLTSGAFFQLGEIELFGEEAPPPAEPVTCDPGTILGVGTEALLGNDLTDFGNNGDPLLYSPPDDLGGFDAEFFSSDEPGFEGGEFAFNVFDNTLGGGNEKWCCGTVFPQTVGADFGDAQYTLTHFTVSSANDVPERDPRVWRIEGSNDGADWTTIFSQDNPDHTIWQERDQVIRFDQSIDYPEQTETYSMFRMVTEATGLTEDAFFQLGEIEFFDANFVILPRGEVLGTGTDALLGNDRTDLGDDGDPLLYSPPDLGGFDAEFFSSDEPGFEGGEFAFNVFDNMVGGGNEKWCCGTAFPQIVGADFGDAPFVLTHFTVTSGNDSPERDPRVWSIEGSNDGVDWTTIFSQNNAFATLWAERDQVILFEGGVDFPEQTEAYSMYRMVTDATGATEGAFFQLGEVELFGEGIEPTGPRFVRGDVTADGEINISDGISTLNNLLSGGPPPSCEKAADSNDDGKVNIADPVYLLNNLFYSGPLPPAPNPDCGTDPTEDALTCDSFPPCEE